MRPELTFWKISHVWKSYALAGSMSLTLSVVPYTRVLCAHRLDTEHASPSTSSSVNNLFIRRSFQAK